MALAFSMERGIDGIKVGIGPEGACTTRVNVNFGVPQVQALVECRTVTAGRVPLIADGGVKRHGAFVQALTFGGDTVTLGSMLAGTTETPGDVVQKRVVVPDSNKTVYVRFKVFRGMTSLRPSSTGWMSRMRTLPTSRRLVPRVWRSASPCGPRWTAFPGHVETPLLRR